MRHSFFRPFYFFLSVLSIPLFVLPPGVFSQFSPQEVNQRQNWEELLKKADILRSELIGTGVTRPMRLYMIGSDGEFSACWKNPSGMPRGHLEGWRFEIAAYELDKLLGLNMIPPTVERTFRGKPGSLQLWVNNTQSDKDRLENAVPIPEDKLLTWSRHKYLTRAFDCLIANDDRTQQNILYTQDWRTILIDHSRAFRSSKLYTRRLVYGHNGIKGEQLIRNLPRSFVSAVTHLNIQTLQDRLNHYLTEKEILSIFKRKKLLLEEIDRMIKEEGESAVLY